MEDKPTFNAEEIVQQQDAIRRLAEARVSAVLVEGAAADQSPEDFGLESDKYDTYTDVEAPIGGGFVRFVSREDPSDTIAGLSWMLIAGDTSDPDRSTHCMALLSNGDIQGRVTTENSEGTTHTNITASAGSQETRAAAKYRSHLASMHRRAMLAMSEDNSTSRGVETGMVTPKSLVGRILGHLSIRK